MGNHEQVVKKLNIGITNDQCEGAIKFQHSVEFNKEFRK